MWLVFLPDEEAKELKVVAVLKPFKRQYGNYGKGFSALRSRRHKHPCQRPGKGSSSVDARWAGRQVCAYPCAPRQTAKKPVPHHGDYSPADKEEISDPPKHGLNSEILCHYIDDLAEQATAGAVACRYEETCAAFG